MTASIKQLLTLVGPAIHQLPIILLAFLTLSTVELFGLGLLIPYVEFIFMGDFSSVGNQIMILLGLERTPREDLLLIFSSLIVMAFVLKFGLTMAMVGVINNFAQKQRIKLGTRFLRIILNQSFLDYLRRSEADGIYEIQTVTSHYYTALQLVLRSVSDIILIGCIITFIGVVDPLVLLVTFVVMLLLLGGYLFLFRRHLVTLGKVANTAESGVINITKDAFRGYRELRLLGKVEAFIELLRVELSKAGKASVRLGYHSVIPRNLLELVVVLLFVGAFIAAQAFNIDQQRTSSVAIVYVLAVMRMLPLVTGVTASMARFRSMKDSIQRITDYMLLDKDKPQQGQNVSSGKIPFFESLQISNAKFTYPKSVLPLCNDINLKINRGEVIGIVGASGTGKTTLLNIIAGFLEPQQGEVLINGKNVGAVASADLSFGYIPQDTLSFNDTVFNNIVMGDDDKPENRLRATEALATAQLADVVNSLPRGQDTRIGDFGSLFSGGQRQRLAIARAIYHEKSFLILDEATNALDEETEARLIDALRTHPNTSAIIIVSHRPSTLKFCDKIFQLADGSLQVVSRDVS